MLNKLKDEVQEIYIFLGNIAGKDPNFDSELRGRVQATLALITVSHEDIYGETPQND